VGLRYLSRPSRVAAEVLYGAVRVTQGALVRVNPSNMRVEARLPFAAGEDNAQAVAVKGNYVYVGLGTSPGKVVKVNRKTWLEEDVVTFLAGENNVQALVIDGDFLYAGLGTSPAQVVKVSLTPFARDSALPFAAGENDCRAMLVYGGKIYCALYTVVGRVVRVDIAGFSKDVPTLSLGAGENNVYCLAREGDFLYCGCDVSPGRVVKVSFVPFARVTGIVLAAAEEFVEGLASDGTYLYAGCATDPGLIVRIIIATFAKDTTLDVLTPYTTYIDCLIVLGKFIYAGTNAYGYPGLIIKVSIASFAVSRVAILKGETSGIDLAISGTWGFAGLDQYPGNAARFNLTTFTEAGRADFDYLEDECMAIDADSSYAYGCTYTSPVHVKKINAASNIVEDTLPLSAGNDYAASALVYGGKLYIGLNLGAVAGRIVKVDLAKFSQEDVLVLLADEQGIFGLCTDGTYLYATTNNGRVVRISLATFTRVDRYVSGYNLGACDVLGGYVYAGRSTGQGRVLKIDKATMGLDTDLNLGAGFSSVSGCRATGGFVYVTTVNSPGRVVKLNPGPPFAIDSWIALGAGEDSPFQLRVSGGKLYTVCYTYPAIVAKVDIAGFSEDAPLTLEPADDNCWAVAGL